MKNYLLLLVALVFASPSAFAMGHFSLLGGVDYNLDSTTAAFGGASATVKGGLGFGGGFLVSISSLELGALYLSKKTTTESTILGVTTSTSSSSTGIEIPLMYRFGGLTSFGLGGFFDISTTTGGSSNYGITAGPRFGMTNGFFFDARFNYGLKSPNTKDVLAMLGYSFGK